MPGFDRIRLDREVFFSLFIPPLLYSDRQLISKRDLFAAVRPVLLLAFELVVFTVVGVGYLVHWLIPSIPLAAAFVLGAIASPTNIMAVSAVTQRRLNSAPSARSISAFFNATEAALTASALIGPVTNGSISSLGIDGSAAAATTAFFVLLRIHAPVGIHARCRHLCLTQRIQGLQEVVWVD